MIGKKAALKVMIVLLSVVVIFHLCVLFECVSYDKVWAGKIDSLDEMRVFETISILINLLLIATLLLKSKHIQNKVSNKVVNGIIWFFVFLFALNTVGNLFAKSVIEQTLGTGLTLVSAALCWAIVRKEKSGSDNSG